MDITNIQKWEREFSAKKGIAQDEEKSTKIATLKLVEEVGEVCKAILEKKMGRSSCRDNRCNCFCL